MNIMAGFDDGPMNSKTTESGQETITSPGSERSDCDKNDEETEQLQNIEDNEGISTQEVQDNDEENEEQYSDIETASNTISSEIESQLQYVPSGSEHVSYFVNTLSHAMDSLDVDKSLAIQAQLSGKLNNEVQKIKDKREQVISKLDRLNTLYEENFVIKSPHNHSKVSQLQIDIHEIEKRLDKLKNGSHKNQASFLAGLFKSNESDLGIVSSYPIEYNQAKDRTLER